MAMLRFEDISSAKNPLISAVRELATRKGRKAERAFLCDGEHMVTEALRMCPQEVRSIFVETEKRARFEPLLETLLTESLREIPLYAVPPHVMAALSQVKTPQGVAAVLALPCSTPLESLGDRLILLENVQDPGNVGTILRTLDAAGFDGCILTAGCADPFSPKTLSATMGSVFRVPLCFEGVPSGADVAQTLQKVNYAVIAAMLEGEPFYERASLPAKLCLMIGGEGAGLSAETARAATHRYRLPMRGGAESLNAAVAAGVMMYDLMNRGEV